MSKSNITEMVLDRIKSWKSDYVFTAFDFVDLGEINTIWQILSRLEQSKEIHRIMRGVYYCPLYSELLQEFEAPSIHQVSKAIARKHGWTIAPSGNTALNHLGLSTQVSSQWSYISDGPYNKYHFNNSDLEFRHCSNKDISGLSYKTAVVIQALKAIGKNNVTDEIVLKLKNLLTDEEKDQLLIESKTTTSWIYSNIKKICR